MATKVSHIMTARFTTIIDGYIYWWQGQYLIKFVTSLQPGLKPMKAASLCQQGLKPILTATSWW